MYTSGFTEYKYFARRACTKGAINVIEDIPKERERPGKKGNSFPLNFRVRVHSDPRSKNESLKVKRREVPARPSSSDRSRAARNPHRWQTTAVFVDSQLAKKDKKIALRIGYERATNHPAPVFLRKRRMARGTAENVRRDLRLHKSARSIP